VPPPGFADLSEREREILALIGAGRSNAEIAEELVISPRTVKRHVENAFARTGVRGRKGLMALLYE
jgi:DNA-binding CsgD family transcriptional regulator